MWSDVSQSMGSSRVLLRRPILTFYHLMKINILCFPNPSIAPLTVSNATGAKGAQNLQVMRTVLSQKGARKPGQATIRISQATLPQSESSAGVLTAAQVRNTIIFSYRLVISPSVLVRPRVS